MERRRTAVLHHSRFSNLARFRFSYRLKPVFYPVPTHFLPLSFPVLVPFLYCLPIISNTRHFQPNHWTTSDHHWSTGPVGGLNLWRRDARNQFVRYVCSTHGGKESGSVRKAIGQGAPIAKKKRRLNGPDDRRGWPSLVGCRPSCLRHPTNQTWQLSILVNGRRLCQPQFSNCKAQARRTVCTGNPLYRSSSKGREVCHTGAKG